MRAGAVARRPPIISCRPSELDRDRLYFRVLLERVLAHFATDAGLLKAAEWSGRVEHVEAVDPDSAGTNVVGDGMHFADIPRPDRGREAVGRVVGPGGH